MQLAHSKTQHHHRAYTVHTFETGPAALAGLGAINAPVHIPVTDAIMP
ncbi:MAG: hypothetical protein OEZ06_30860 [Myxococcales bacterium]|nr:hypothetical protein [Myxococcales bacterium]